MQYRKFGNTGLTVSALGYGCMRFPTLKDGSIDEEETIRLLRHGIDNGINYIDTAYSYHGGKSEILLSKVLAGGYREKVYLADKNPVWLVKKYEDFEALLDEQLQKLKTDRIDLYLLHSLDKNSWERIRDLDVLRFVDKAKRDGKIGFAGFSFHDKTDVFKEIIDSYGWDFCQMQYNYMDEHEQAGVEGLRYAYAKGLGVVIMEPLRGGKLSNYPPESVRQIWDSAEEKRTPAEWALRWIWDQREVSVVLSGMNSMSQVDENIKVAGSALPGNLSAEEKRLIEKARDRYIELTKVGCTGCRYCMPCPSGVDIPRIFSLYNEASMYNDLESCAARYRKKEAESGASRCIRCGKCEKACPQHIKIKDQIQNAHRVLSGK